MPVILTDNFRVQWAWQKWDGELKMPKMTGSMQAKQKVYNISTYLQIIQA